MSEKVTQFNGLTLHTKYFCQISIQSQKGQQSLLSGHVGTNRFNSDV